MTTTTAGAAADNQHPSTSIEEEEDNGLVVEGGGGLLLDSMNSSSSSRILVEGSTQYTNNNNMKKKLHSSSPTATTTTTTALVGGGGGTAATAGKRQRRRGRQDNNKNHNKDKVVRPIHQVGGEASSQSSPEPTTMMSMAMNSSPLVIVTSSWEDDDEEGRAVAAAAAASLVSPDPSSTSSPYHHHLRGGVGVGVGAGQAAGGQPVGVGVVTPPPPLLHQSEEEEEEETTPMTEEKDSPTYYYSTSTTTTTASVSPSSNKSATAAITTTTATGTSPSMPMAGAMPTTTTATSHQQNQAAEGGEGTTTTVTTTMTTSIALDFSANACVCLQDEDLRGALAWYQRALLVYQDAATALAEQQAEEEDLEEAVVEQQQPAPQQLLSSSQKDFTGQAAAEQQQPLLLSIVDTCNAAATLHNMGAVYNALQQIDAALQCYHDAEQLYRECRTRLNEGATATNNANATNNVQLKVSPLQLQDQETVCLTALIAETLHHRAQIYESGSLWDTVAALECHEACVELLRNEPGVDIDLEMDQQQQSQQSQSQQQQQHQDPSAPTTLLLAVTVVDDVYFQQDINQEAKIEWLTMSYQALAKLYRNSDTPKDGLLILQEWKDLLLLQKQQNQQKQQVEDETEEQPPKEPAAPARSSSKWDKSLVECWKQLSEFYFSQEEMTLGVEALHNAMDLQLSSSSSAAATAGSGTATITKEPAPSSTAVATSSSRTSPTPTQKQQQGNTGSNSSSETAAATAPPDDSSIIQLPSNLLEQMNHIGLNQERRGNYDEALACYEKVLLLVSRYLGEDHWEVAETLVKIGRVMELQGNVAGGLDLYQAAHTIYQTALKNTTAARSNSNDKKNRKNNRKKKKDNTGDVDVVVVEDDLEETNNALHHQRAATESVVRIANVLMSQKRWQEAVQFLHELPQAKEWMSSLEDWNSSTTSASASTIPKTSAASNTTSQTPSVDQAIVFRELGRAYMGMGELVKAKQCLLESAKRLEGTDFEEDVFELLMHVEFCQKQERKAAMACRRARSRSRSRGRGNRGTSVSSNGGGGGGRGASSSRQSRARSRSSTSAAGDGGGGHRSKSRANSVGSSSRTASSLDHHQQQQQQERGSGGSTNRITKDAVAAVLSPGSNLIDDKIAAVEDVNIVMTKADPPQPILSSAMVVGTPPRGKPQRAQETLTSLPASPDRKDKLVIPPKSPQSPTPLKTLGAAPRTSAATTPTPTTSPQKAQPQRRTLEKLRNAPLLLGESNTGNTTNTRSQGNLGIKVGDKQKSVTAGMQHVVVAPTAIAPGMEEDPFDMPPRDSFQVQRAKDIIMKRVNQDAESKSSGGSRKQDLFLSTNAATASNPNEDDDGKSDVVSSVLVGLDIDIDLPPPSPTMMESRSGSVLAGLAALPSRSNEKPFDEATASKASSRERPFDERSSQVGIKQSPFNMSVQEHMMMAFQDEAKPRTMTPGLVLQSMSDLTSAGGHTSASSSVMDGVFAIDSTPPLLSDYAGENQHDSDPFRLVPPPPPPPKAASPPCQIETIRSSTQSPPTKQEHGKIQVSVGNQAQRDVFPTQSLTVEKQLESPKRMNTDMRGPLERISPIAKYGEDNDHDDDDDDSDASSDPFEGYDDYEDGEEARDTSGSATGSAESPSYCGDSESEQGYNRFSKEDLSSEEENSTSSYLGDREDDERKKLSARNSFQPHTVMPTFDDTRQPHQAQETHPDSCPLGRRESPVPTPDPILSYASKTSEPDMFDTGPTSDIQETEQPLVEEKEPIASPKPTAKRSSRKQGNELSKGSPGNRIVKALSNSIRRRRKPKKNTLFESIHSDPEPDASGEGKEDKVGPLPTVSPPMKVPSNTIERQESDTFQGGPMQFVSMTSPSYDETVSQITFTVDDNYGKYNKSSQWWGQLSLPTEQLEGYLHQAVEAAEGFLSAKAIHAKMKSQPLDFDSEDEEDDDLIVRDRSTVPLANTSASKAEGAACSPVRNSLLFEPADQLQPAKTIDDEIKISPVIIENEAVMPIAAAPSTLMVIDHHGLPSPKNNVNKEIERQEELLKQYELEALNDDKATPKVSSTLFRLSILYLQNENLDEALKATNEALRHQKFLGDSPNAARSLHLLADIFVRKGEFESALSCYAEVQELELDLYGYIHEETANTLNRIGSVLARQSKFSMAMDKHQEALRILKECHGEELRHPLVSQTLIHIGAVYYRERNSLATVRKGIDGYSTFIEVGMLEVIGRAHEDRGSYKMAISFFEEKLQCLHQKQKDPKSKEGFANLEDVATTLNSLGMLSCRAGIFMEAIDYYDKALEVQKQIGCDKMHIATARVLTATVQFHLGFFQKALRMLQDALTELQDETGSEHETVAATWFQIGVVQVAMCEYDDGMDALEEALRIQTNILGKVHPATLRTRREIGNMYAIYESELDAAFCQFNDILTLQRRIHGHKHPNVAETLHSLGCAYARKGDFANAVKTLEECYYMRIDFLGADHPLQATTLHEIAEIHRKRQRYRKAIHISNAVLEIRKESLSERHIDVARALATKASCLVVTGDYANAMQCLQEAFSMAEQAVGARHPAVADIFVHMGGIHLRKCHFDEAKEWVGKAMDIYQNSNLDEDHPSWKEAVALMERVDRDEMLCV